jgi:hypothetical protein
LEALEKEQGRMKEGDGRAAGIKEKKYVAEDIK